MAVPGAGDWCLMIMKTLRQCSHFQEGVWKGGEGMKWGLGERNNQKGG